MAERPGPIHEAVNHIEAAFIALGRSIATGIRATRQDYTLCPPERPRHVFHASTRGAEASEGTGEAQEGSQ